VATMQENLIALCAAYHEKQHRAAVQYQSRRQTTS